MENFEICRRSRPARDNTPPPSHVDVVSVTGARWRIVTHEADDGGRVCCDSADVVVRIRVRGVGGLVMKQDPTICKCFAFKVAHNPGVIKSLVGRFFFHLSVIFTPGPNIVWVI